MSELVTKELGELHTHPKTPKTSLSLSLCARKNSLASFTHPKLPISLSLSLCKEKFSGELHTPKTPNLSLSLSLSLSLQGKNSLMSFTRTQNSQCLSLLLQGKFFTMSTKTSNPQKNWNLLTLQSIEDASLTNPYNIYHNRNLSHCLCKRDSPSSSSSSSFFLFFSYLKWRL